MLRSEIDFSSFLVYDSNTVTFVTTNRTIGSILDEKLDIAA